MAETPIDGDDINPTSLEDLSQQYGILRERVRQIEVRAFAKLQKAIKAAVERRLVTHCAAALARHEVIVTPCESGARACLWHEQGRSLKSLPPLGSTFALVKETDDRLD